MHRFLVILFLSISILADAAENANISWIWNQPTAQDNQRVCFRRDFEVPKDLVAAEITASADNWYRLWINGKFVDWNQDWTQVGKYDVSKLLEPGTKNLIAIEAGNQDAAAGLALSLKMTINSGKVLRMSTDHSWQCSDQSPNGWETKGFDAHNWQPAVELVKMGGAPWGDLFNARSAPAAPGIKVAQDFELKKLYNVPSEQGSWVAMTMNARGELICSDQYGALYLVVPAAANSDQAPLVKPLAAAIAGAHGLLWHRGNLYVTVNETVGGESGVYRLTNPQSDDQFGKPELLKSVAGRSEHGPHGLVASPDGEWIYFVAGNHTDLAKMDNHLPLTNWAEDQLLPRQPDANGHARTRMAPGGWIARFRPTDNYWELVSIGYRNTYDIGFNLQGDLFAYDSDMEWDLGAPWYRPTRINYVMPGSELGWRNGSGKWPAYYEDSLAPCVEIGPGCPTGVISGKGAAFPERYQRAIYAMDWTFGTIYAIHPNATGAIDTATTEEFIAGENMPFTDGVIGSDGHMYFLTGGRRTQSALWRVRYTGKENTSPVKTLPATKLTQQRRELEQGILNPSTANLDLAWRELGSTDRTQRYAARLILEKQAPDRWLARLSSEKDPWRVIGATMALARMNHHDSRSQCFKSLLQLPWPQLNEAQKINWLRAVGLLFIRHGEPTNEEKAQLIPLLSPLFPQQSSELNRELCRMLCYIQAPGIVERVLQLMDAAAPEPQPNWAELATRNKNYGGTVQKMLANYPPVQNLFYAYCLRVMPGPWASGQRERHLAWLDRAASCQGGNSYKGYVRMIREETLSLATQEEKQRLIPTQNAVAPSYLTNLPEVSGPGRMWTVDAVTALAAKGLEDADLAAGKKMFQASLCAACHAINGEGGASGPQLTALAGRFSARDIAESIIEPSQVISDQYNFDTISKKDGSKVFGKILAEKDEILIVATNAFDMTQREEIAKHDVSSIKPSPVSPMPPGLINRLNETELRNLLAYLLSKHE